MTGKIVCPGFIDAHIHLESSSLVTPAEFARAVLPHGTTTVITDPHEITNVMGTDGIDYMLQATEGLPIDVRFMLPSCVPATPHGRIRRESGLPRHRLASIDHPRVHGSGGNDELPRRDRRRPRRHCQDRCCLRRTTRRSTATPQACPGTDLNAYVAAGVYSDHECADIGRRHAEAAAAASSS